MCEYAELRKKKKEVESFLNLYPIVEAMALKFTGTADGLMFGVDDGDRVNDLVQLVGAMYLDCLKGLDEMPWVEGWPGVLDPPEKGGPIRNIAMVMGEMCGLADQWESIGSDKSWWKQEIIKIARRRGITLMTCGRTVVEYTDFGEEEEGAEVKERDFLKIVSFDLPSSGRRAGS